MKLTGLAEGQQRARPDQCIIQDQEGKRTHEDSGIQR